MGKPRAKATKAETPVDEPVETAKATKTDDGLQTWTLKTWADQANGEIRNAITSWTLTPRDRQDENWLRIIEAEGASQHVHTIHREARREGTYVLRLFQSWERLDGGYLRTIWEHATQYHLFRAVHGEPGQMVTLFCSDQASGQEVFVRMTKGEWDQLGWDGKQGVTSSLLGRLRRAQLEASRSLQQTDKVRIVQESTPGVPDFWDRADESSRQLRYLREPTQEGGAK